MREVDLMDMIAGFDLVQRAFYASLVCWIEVMDLFSVLGASGNLDVKRSPFAFIGRAGQR